MKKIIFLILAIPLWMLASLHAQNNVTVQSLMGTHVDTILKYHLAGEGVELSNGKFNNTPGIVNANQIGSFNRNNYTQFPFATGLVMTTGAVTIAQGPNDQAGASSATGNYTDATLQQYATNNVTNCAALDFDFLAYADTFAFNYVFGSEEYPNFVCASYNDIFIFLLTPSPGLRQLKMWQLYPVPSPPPTHKVFPFLSTQLTVDPAAAAAPTATAQPTLPTMSPMAPDRATTACNTTV